MTAQLDMCLEERRHSQVDAVLEYTFKEYGCDKLRSKPCLLSTKRSYVYPHQAFLPGSILGQFSLSPYLYELDDDFATQHLKIVLSLAVRQEPDLDDIFSIQKEIYAAAGGVIQGDTQLQTIITSVSTIV